MVVKNSTIQKEDLGGGLSRKILARGGKLMMVEVYFDKGGIGAMHSHPHEQVSYIVKGAFEFNIDGKKDVVKAGDILLILESMKIENEIFAPRDGKIREVFVAEGKYVRRREPLVTIEG